MLEWGNKSNDKIQQIFASAKAKFISKKATKVNGNFTIMSKSRNLTTKKKANNNNKCFNCEKLGYWGQDCTLLNYCAKKSKSDKPSSSKQQ